MSTGATPSRYSLRPWTLSVRKGMGRQGSPALGTPRGLRPEEWRTYNFSQQARVFKVTLLRSTGFVATHSACVSPRS